MRYERVMIKRDTQTTHNRAVPPWEIPILEMIFGDGNVEPTGEFELVMDRDNPEEPRDYPDPSEEYDRLVQRYKKDPETKLEIVAQVYGQSRKGVRELAKAIDDARRADEDAEFERKQRVARRRATNARRFAADPLLA